MLRDGLQELRTLRATIDIGGRPGQGHGDDMGYGDAERTQLLSSAPSALPLGIHRHRHRRLMSHGDCAPPPAHSKLGRTDC